VNQLPQSLSLLRIESPLKRMLMLGACLKRFRKSLLV
jgi:hypothetical protein